MTKTGNSHFLINDLELAQLTLGQVHAHFQVISIFLCKVGGSNFILRKYKPDTDYELFFLSNDLGLALINLGQIHDAHKQSYSKVTIFNDSPLEILIIKINNNNKI